MHLFGCRGCEMSKTAILALQSQLCDTRNLLQEVLEAHQKEREALLKQLVEAQNPEIQRAKLVEAQKARKKAEEPTSPDEIQLKTRRKMAFPGISAMPRPPYVGKVS